MSNLDLNIEQRVDEARLGEGLYARSLIEASIDPLFMIGTEGKLDEGATVFFALPAKEKENA